jgi:hypothetical protein
VPCWNPKARNRAPVFEAPSDHINLERRACTELGPWAYSSMSISPEGTGEVRPPGSNAREARGPRVGGVRTTVDALHMERVAKPSILASWRGLAPSEGPPLTASLSAPCPNVSTVLQPPSTV